MKPEPLKDKERILIESWLDEKQIKDNPTLKGWLHKEQDILSAVEWLKEKHNKLIDRLVKKEITLEKFIIENDIIIIKAFQDVIKK